jgi:hypothetical protein
MYRMACTLLTCRDLNDLSRSEASQGIALILFKSVFPVRIRHVGLHRRAIRLELRRVPSRLIGAVGLTPNVSLPFSCFV